VSTFRTSRPAFSGAPPAKRTARPAPGIAPAPGAVALLAAGASTPWAAAPVLPAPAAAGFRAGGPALPASPAGRGVAPPAVFPTASVAEAAATRPSQRAVQVGSAAARREARRLVARSAGKPLDPAEASLADGAIAAGGVSVHEDARAGQAAVLLGAHAFALGDRIFLGPTVDTPGGPSREEALRHELVHRAQGKLGSLTGRIAPRPALEGQAHEQAKGRRLESELLGADPSEIHEWLWIPARWESRTTLRRGRRQTCSRPPSHRRACP
jgi:hypothetical protein